MGQGATTTPWAMHMAEADERAAGGAAPRHYSNGTASPSPRPDRTPRARGKAKGMRWCCRRFPERALAISSRLPAPAAAGPCGPIIGICRATPQKHDIRLSFSGALHAIPWSGRRKSSASADLTGVGVTVTQLSG